MLLGASAVRCRPISQLEVTKQDTEVTKLATPVEYREDGTLHVLPYQYRE